MENRFFTSFSHIYVEEAALQDELTQRVLGRFSTAQVIRIQHYKDIFNRANQNVKLQKRVKTLVLARNQGQKIFPGAPVCQSFGAEHFYYTAPAMNCVFDCDYCFLKGMYPSGMIVLFTNMQDYYDEIDAMLKAHPMYLSISYDTDLAAMEELTGYLARWIAYTSARENLTIEIRTKAALTTQFFERLKTGQSSRDAESSREADHSRNIVFAFTLSPDRVIKEMEKGTASLRHRLQSARLAAENGYEVRLCFDPVMYVAGCEEAYQTMLTECFTVLKAEQIRDASIGTFRISAEYMKQLRKVESDSRAMQYPFENTKGVYHYPKRIENRMMTYIRTGLRQYLPKEKIFEWNSGEEEDSE